MAPEAISQPDTLGVRTLGDFALREQIGAGGFGDIYLAEQIGLQREAIIKVLRADAIDGAAEDRTAMFLREAKLASRLDHPYAAHIYAFGAEPDGVLWIAMESVRGASLRAILESQGPMAIERFVPFFERICEVVHTAHEQSIIHRDLKPDNIMVISRAGRLLPKLLDFGIAYAVVNDVLQGSAAAPPGGALGSGIVGSPSYMAPELWLNQNAAVAGSDQYALGALVYEMLTGKILFTGRTVMEVARAHSRNQIPPLGLGLRPELDVVVKKALSRAPGDRYGNVLELAQALRDASGIAAASTEIPRIDEALRTRYLASAPQPIADAIAAYDAARNAHQAREAMRTVLRVAAWYLGLLALASRTRVGGGGAKDSEHAQALLRDLGRHGLTPSAWIALAREFTHPFLAFPDTHPLPELVLLLHPATGTNPLTAALEGSLGESLADSSDDAAGQAVARELPVVVGVLRAIEFLLDYRLVAPRGDGAQLWMGTRSGAKIAIQLQRSLPVDRLVIVDASGGPLLALWPLIQIHEPMPAHPVQLFMLAGPGRQGARLVSSPQAFEHRDDELWDWFRDALFDPNESGRGGAGEDSPYRGLSAYSNSDAGWFFGRERETEALVNRLKVEGFVAVVGPSGVGKSSFVHAGVAPALTGWSVVTTRPGRAPLAQLLGHLLSAEVAIDGDDRSPSAIADAIDAWVGGRAGLLVVVDQFEELFTLGNSAEDRQRFVDVLLAITRTISVAVRVVITVRDDFLIRTEQIPGLAQALARGLQLLGPLSAAALERILVEPARRARYEFEDPTLPAEMVRAIIDTPAAVALLSFTASRLWELRDRHFRQLPRRAYDALGGVGGALARHADATLEAMPASERALARKAFRHLVTFEGTRAVLGRDEFVQLVGGGAAADGLVERLIGARLLSSSEDDSGEPVIEIVHEALVGAWPQLAEWRREDLEGSRFHEQLRAAAKQWQDRGRPRGLLWRGDALAEYQLWRKRTTPNLTPIEAGFAAASTADATRGRRIRRALLGVAAAITATFVGVLWRANAAEQASRRGAESMLRDSTFEQGRLLMVQGDKLPALAPLRSAYEMGATGAPIRLLIEEALRSARAKRMVLAGHTGRIWSVAFGLDGVIVSGSADHTMRIWDASSGAQVGIVPFQDSVYEVAVNATGSLALGATGKVVQVWDVKAHRVVATLDRGEGLTDAKFSPQGTQLALAGNSGGVKIWQVPDGKLIGELAPDRGDHEGTSIDFCANGECLITWDRGGTIVLWDAHALSVRARYTVPLGPRGWASVQQAVVNRDGSVIAVGMETGKLHLIRANAPMQTIQAHEEGTINVAFSPDNTTVVTTSIDRSARLWDVQTGTRRALLAGHAGMAMALQFSQSGAILVTAGMDRTARLWEGATGVFLGDLVGHTNTASSAALSPDGHQLVTGSWDHTAIVWDVETAAQFKPIGALDPDESLNHTRAVFRPDNQQIAIGTANKELAIFDVRSGRVVCRAPVELPITRLAWRADGGGLATLSDGDTVARLWSPACELRGTVTHPQISSVAFGSDGLLLTGGGDKAIRAWGSDGRLTVTLHDMPGNVVEIGVSVGEIYAITSTAAAVVLVDLATQQRRVFSADVQLTSVAIDARRHRVMASSFDENVIRVWDDVSGRLLTKLEGGGSMYGVRLSPDGVTIAGVGGQSPYLWNADTWDRIAVLEGHRAAVNNGAFAADHMFVTSSIDDTTRVWDALTGRQLLVQNDADSSVVSDDGQHIMLSGNNGARLWSLQMPAPDLGEIDRLVPKSQ